LMRGAHRRRSCKAEQGVASPERFATARGRQRPAPLEPRPQEQPLLPGPGKNDNKMLGRARKRHGGAPRGAASGRSGAGLSPRKKVRARVRSCTHSGCTQHPGAYRRSARPSRGGEKKKEKMRSEEQGIKKMKGL